MDPEIEKKISDRIEKYFGHLSDNERKMISIVADIAYLYGEDSGRNQYGMGTNLDPSIFNPKL